MTGRLHHARVRTPQELKSPALVATYVAMLSLPRFAAPALDAAALQAKLCAAAAAMNGRHLPSSLQSEPWLSTSPSPCPSVSVPPFASHSIPVFPLTHGPPAPCARGGGGGGHRFCRIITCCPKL